MILPWPLCQRLLGISMSLLTFAALSGCRSVESEATSAQESFGPGQPASLPYLAPEHPPEHPGQVDAELPPSLRPPAHGSRVVIEPEPIDFGTPEEPFVPLPSGHAARTMGATAVVSPTGVVLPVIASRDATSTEPESWLVVTPCADVRLVSGLTPLGRAHVMLDPGHGGWERGAVGPTGVVEAEVNLAVAEATKHLLEERGATVVLTRTADTTMMTSVRALLARSVLPGLFVSIHHNGGAPANGDRPGTIVFTKSDDETSTRFGGLLHDSLVPMLIAAGEAEQERLTLLAEEEAAAEAEAAAAAEAATAAAEPTEPDAEAAGEAEPPPEFRWAGSGNAGVRPWRGDDGRDILSVLRQSGDVPAALAEMVYVTNPFEEALLHDPAFIEAEAAALAEAIGRLFSTDEQGSGFIADQIGDENVGGGGGSATCREPDLGLGANLT